jgi:acetyl esterase/lipase
MPRADPSADGEDRRVLGRAERPPDRTWTYGSDAEQVADVYLPESTPSRRTVLLVHGGFWRPEFDRVHARPLAAHLAARGHVVVSVEYRRLPGNPDVTLRDVRVAADTLAREPWADGSSIQAVGHSAGGHLVLVLAGDTDTPLQSVLALAPVADLVAAETRGLDGDAVASFLGTPAADRPDLDPVRRPAPMIPVAIVHGVNDSIVPLKLSATYVEAHGVDGHQRLVALPGIGHYEVIDPEATAIADVDAALDALAAQGPVVG